LRDGKWRPSVGYKFSIGLGLSALAFFALSVSIGFAASDHRVGMEWPDRLLCCSRQLQNYALSPIGLSIMTQIAPKKLSGPCHRYYG